MARLTDFFRRREPKTEPRLIEEIPITTNADRRASQVQQRLLTQIPIIDGWDHHLSYLPCDAVGGDFVDVSPMDDGRILLTIGDVSGHGTQGALIAVSARKTIRALVGQAATLGELVVSLNEDLRSDLLPGQFITAFFALLDPSDGRLVYCSAGHHMALIIDPAGPTHVRRLAGKGMALGIASSDRMGEHLTLRETNIAVGASLVIYTDGISETRNPNSDEEFSEEQVLAQLIGNSRLPLAQQVETLVTAAQAHHGGELEDDATVLAIRRR